MKKFVAGLKGVQSVDFSSATRVSGNSFDAVRLVIEEGAKTVYVDSLPVDLVKLNDLKQFARANGATVIVGDPLLSLISGPDAVQFKQLKAILAQGHMPDVDQVDVTVCRGDVARPEAHVNGVFALVSNLLNAPISQLNAASSGDLDGVTASNVKFHIGYHSQVGSTQSLEDFISRKPVDSDSKQDKIQIVVRFKGDKDGVSTLTLDLPLAQTAFELSSSDMRSMSLDAFYEAARLSTLFDESVKVGGKSTVLRRPTNQTVNIGIGSASAGINGDAVWDPAGTEDQGGQMVVVGATSRKPEPVHSAMKGHLDHPISGLAHLEDLIAMLAKTPNPVLYLPMIPSALKRKGILLAVKAGITVLAEKPLLSSTAEIEELQTQLARIKGENDVASKPTGKVVVGQHSLVHPAHQLIMDVIVAQGDIEDMTFDFSWPKSDADKTFYLPCGGLMTDIGIYPISFFNEVFGADKFSNEEDTTIRKTRDGKAEDEVVTTLVYEDSKGSSVKCHMTISSRPETDGKSYLEIKFKNGNVLKVFDPVHPHRAMDPGKFAILLDSDGRPVDNGVQQLPGDGKSSYRFQWELMERIAKGDSDVPKGMTVESALGNARVMDTVLAVGGLEKKMLT